MGMWDTSVSLALTNLLMSALASAQYQAVSPCQTVVVMRRLLSPMQEGGSSGQAQKQPEKQGAAGDCLAMFRAGTEEAAEEVQTGATEEVKTGAAEKVKTGVNVHTGAVEEFSCRSTTGGGADRS